MRKFTFLICILFIATASMGVRSPVSTKDKTAEMRRQEGKQRQQSRKERQQERSMQRRTILRLKEEIKIAKQRIAILEIINRKLMAMCKSEGVSDGDIAAVVKNEKKQAKRSDVLQQELTYLLDIAEVYWYAVDDNSVYIGFSSFPDDGKIIVNGAAIRGNKAINFGCHVWAVHFGQKNNPPYYGTMSGKCYAEATCRYGKLE